MLSGIVSQNNQLWQGHPDVAYFNGQFFVVFRQSRQHRETGRTQIMLTRSRSGFRYDLPFCISESSDRYNCPRISVAGGKLWILCDLINQSDDFNKAENKEENTRIILFCSSDGEKWDGPINTNITGIVPDRICKTNDNNFLIATHGWRMTSSNGEGHLCQNVWRNNSLYTKNWKRHSLADDDGLNLCEASICNTGNELVCLMRENSQRGDPAYWTYSEDNGMNWLPVKKTRLFGCHRPVIGKLSSGNYVTTYREQSFGHSPPYWAKNTFACWTLGTSMSDRMSPCSKSIILPLDHDFGPRSDSGYTGWVETEDRQIYIVNYVSKEQKAHIVWYIIEEKDF